jgi:hypothetical protein
MWYARSFKIITTEKAQEFGLIWYRNVYGDEIRYNGYSRSIWRDKYYRMYRIHELHRDKPLNMAKTLLDYQIEAMKEYPEGADIERIAIQQFCDDMAEKIEQLEKMMEFVMSKTPQYIMTEKDQEKYLEQILKDGMIAKRRRENPNINLDF